MFLQGHEGRVGQGQDHALGGSKDVVEKASGSVPIGLELRFKWKVEGDKATLDELDGKDVEHVKERLQGEYTKKS